MALLTAKVL